MDQVAGTELVGAMILKRYGVFCNYPPCRSAFEGKTYQSESSMWLDAVAAGWMFGRDRAYEHYCSQACFDADVAVRDKLRRRVAGLPVPRG